MTAIGPVLLAVVAATGCATPSVVTCEDGRSCPLGTLCVPRGCAVEGCGDGDVDAFDGEECDDGNLTSGDGCSSTCQLELCGNRILDQSAGEECDDGNLQSHDGCSSACLNERPLWHVLVSAGMSPSFRYGAAAAWDPDRGTALLHGGSASNGRFNDVWLFDGAWRPGPTGPAAMEGHAIAWDGRGALLLFANDVKPCWLWTGRWAECPGPTPGRRNPRLATRAGGGVVMLGGFIPDARTTWFWDGATWTGGPQGPNPVAGIMVLDRASNRVVATELGGATWAFDTAWSPLEAELQRFAIPGVYNADRRVVTVFGGADAGGVSQDDVREYIDGRWSQVPIAIRPEARQDAAAFYDPIRHGLVILGGASASHDTATWILRWESSTPDETCTSATDDADRDGLAGCDDPDCWGRCDPRNPPGAIDPAPDRPRCGDGACNPALETTALCPKDCS